MSLPGPGELGFCSSGSGLGDIRNDAVDHMGADYILRHHRSECDDRRHARNQVPNREVQGEKPKLITGAIIMLVGIIVGFALATYNTTE
jgi:hypothetical protein